MSLRIVYNGRLGNNLFQYVFGRMLAEKNNLSLETAFPYQALLKTTPHRPGQSWDAPERVIEEGLMPIVFNDDVTRHEHYRNGFAEFVREYKLYGLLEEQLAPGRYTVRGFFENARFFDPHEALVKSFFCLAPLEKNTADLVINVRLGDFADYGLLLDPAWYLDILAREQFDRLYIVGAQPGEPYLEAFRRYDPVVVPSDPVGDFHFIRRFNKIICSNSTFCWWAAFLSEADTIYISDKWISPLIRSCKHATLVPAGCLKGYQAKTRYTAVTYLQGFRGLAADLLDAYVIPNDAAMQDVIDQCIAVLRRSVRGGDRAAYTIRFNVRNTRTFALVLEGGVVRPAARGPRRADCRITFRSWSDFVDALYQEHFFGQALADGTVQATGDLDYFLSVLDGEQLERGMDEVMRDNWLRPNALNPIARRVNHPAYREERAPGPQMARLLAEGRVVGWFRPRPDFGPDGLGDLQVLTTPESRDEADGRHRPCFGDFGPVFAAHPAGHAGDDGGAAPGPDGRYLPLLEELERLGRPPVLLTGAYDRKGDPLTAREALDLLYTRGMDCLVFDNLFVYKQPPGPAQPLAGKPAAVAAPARTGMASALIF